MQREREVALDSLAWNEVDGGRAASIVVQSTSAAAIRIELRWKQAPASPVRVQFRFAGSSGATVFGPVAGDELVTPVSYWSPVLEGERGTIEIFVPGDVTTAGVVLEMPRISHLEIAGSDLSNYRGKRVPEIGDAGSRS